MKRFISESKYSKSELDLRREIESAFSDTRDNTISPNNVVLGETEHLLYVIWPQLISNAEELVVAASDVVYLKAEDLSVLLPAYLILSLGSPDSDLPYLVEDILTPGSHLFIATLEEQLTEVQRKAVCSFINYRLKQSQEGLSDCLDEHARLHAVETYARLARAASHWCAAKQL
jgi:hypothetical protein